ncbi:MAG: hypothetical protein J5741_08550 [Bacteroidales bacterium]|nr:hypothetical protein [Bacteroidales bacterium]
MEKPFEIIMIMVIVLSVCVALPVLIVWMTNKRKQHEIDKKSEMMMSLLEKHPDLDPGEVLNKLNVSTKSVKKSLMERLMSGCMFTFMGLAFLIPHLCHVIFLGNKEQGIFIGGFFLAMGMAYLIYYFVGKKTLRSEIEAEERRMNEQQ